MDAYLSLACFPEVPQVLDALAGRPRVILSNGAPHRLAAAVASAGLGRCFEHVLSVDAVRTYKPSPLVYGLAPQATGIPASDLLFVSSNAWDVAGAKSFGYQVAWCNRTGAPAERLGAGPDVVVTSLAALPGVP
jgi:2-haloacid dehalogenase